MPAGRLADLEGRRDAVSESDLWWFDRATDAHGFATGGTVLTNVHAATACAGRACALHAPSDHPMAGWPLNWRSDRRLMERVCSHGVGHPDPDDVAYRVSRGEPATVAVHGCDGCCAPAGRAGGKDGKE